MQIFNCRRVAMRFEFSHLYQGYSRRLSFPYNNFHFHPAICRRLFFPWPIQQQIVRPSLFSLIQQSANCFIDIRSLETIKLSVFYLLIQLRGCSIKVKHIICKFSVAECLFLMQSLAWPPTKPLCEILIECCSNKSPFGCRQIFWAEHLVTNNCFSFTQLYCRNWFTN